MLLLLLLLLLAMHYLLPVISVHFTLYNFFSISSRFYIFAFLTKIKKWEVELSHKKKNKMLSFAVTWMDLEDMMLSEISQTKKDKYCICLYICIYIHICQVFSHCSISLFLSFLFYFFNFLFYFGL